MVWPIRKRWCKTLGVCVARWSCLSARRSTSTKLRGKPLVVVEIPEAGLDQKPCYYRGAGLTNGAFIRVADGDRKLTPY